jgi:hypothetical protein
MIGGGPTKGKITFGGKVSGNPYTASIETTVKYAAPFDVVVYCTNGNSKSDQVMEVQVSEDGATWTKVGQLKMATTQRYFTKTRVAYNEDKQVYVRLAQTGGTTKPQVYDIYILNNGDVSAYTGVNPMTGASVDASRMRLAEIAPIARDILQNRGIIDRGLRRFPYVDEPTYTEDAY